MHDEDPQMRDDSLVSILIPSYRSGKKLLDSIESVLRQDYRPLQLIVSDDGTEGFDTSSLEDFIAVRTAAMDFEVRHHAENLGTVRNLNTALARAKGKWIIPLAADDMFASGQAVSSLIRQISASGSRWLAAKTERCSQRMEPTGQVVPSESERVLLSEEDAGAVYYRLCCGCFIPSSGTVYDRKLLNEVGGFDAHFQLVEDWPLFLKLVRMNHMPAVSDEVCVLHRGGGTSKHLSGKNQRYQRDLIEIMDQEILPYLEVLDKKKQRDISRKVSAKKAVYQYRFVCKTSVEKMRWIITHLDIILWKLVGKG